MDIESRSLVRRTNIVLELVHKVARWIIVADHIDGIATRREIEKQMQSDLDWFCLPSRLANAQLRGTLPDHLSEMPSIRLERRTTPVVLLDLVVPRSDCIRASQLTTRGHIDVLPIAAVLSMLHAIVGQQILFGYLEDDWELHMSSSFPTCAQFVANMDSSGFKLKAGALWRAL